MNLQLSDGTTMQIPDDASEDAIRNYSARGEQWIKSQPQDAGDPYSAGNTAARIGTGVFTGIPDFLTGAANIISRPGDYVAEKITGQKPNVPDLPMLGQKMREKLNIAELPEDAPWYRHVGEGAASGLPLGAFGAARGLASGAISGASGAARDVLRTAVTPAFTGYAGGKVGGAIGGPDGAFIGSAIGGGLSPYAGGAWRAAIQRSYAGSGRPEAPQIAAAAERAGITPTAGMLGNPTIQARERAFVNEGGPTGLSNRMRETASGQMLDAAEEAAARRGATGAGPAATGENISQLATDVTTRERDASSAGQQALMDRIGPRTDTDISPVLAQMENIRNRTDPGTFRPIDQRIQNLREMLPTDAEGNVTGSTVPYERVKDWRTNLGIRSQTADPVPGRYSGEIYGSTTGAMEEAAASRGVPAQDFQAAQARTRGVEGPGGTVETLEPMAGREGATAYNYLLPGGERNPQRLRSFDDLARGDPRTMPIYGDYMQHIIGETLGREGARGPVNFANRVEGMDPDAAGVIMGPQEPRFRDVATSARAFDYPTNQTGLGKTVGGLTGGMGRAYTLGEVGASIGGALGPGGERIGRALAMAAPAAIRRVREMVMQSEAARRGMAGMPYAGRPMSIQDLITSMTATQGAQQPAP